MLLIIVVNLPLLSQDLKINDSTYNDFLVDHLVSIAENSDTEIDFTELVLKYQELLSKPININYDDITILRNLYLINDFQLQGIVSYLNEYGNMYSILEILQIPGFNKEIVSNLEPFVSVDPIPNNRNINLIKKIRYVNNELIIRTQRIVEPKSGYQTNIDTAVYMPGSIYLGDPYHIYLKYNLDLGGKIKLGFTFDKDPGERLPFTKLNDTIKNSIGNKQGLPLDFFSFFLVINKLSIFKKIIIGDFHIELGQGLVIWSGMSFGSSSGITLQKYPSQIRENRSANENRFFRGISATSKINNLCFTTFYSYNFLDANIVSHSGNNKISSFPESGLHRTIYEITNRKSVSMKSLGLNINYQAKRFSAGITVINSKLSLDIIKDTTKLYRLYWIDRNNISNLSFDFVFTQNRYNLFGEAAYSSNGGFAVLTGLNAFLNDRFNINITCHHFGTEYFSFFSNPAVGNIKHRGQVGIHLGFNVLISNMLSASGYIIQNKSQWLGYQASGSLLTCNQYAVQLEFIPLKNFKLSFRYRHKRGFDDVLFSGSYLPKPNEYLKNDIRCIMKTYLRDAIKLKSVFEVVMSSSQLQTSGMGYLFSQNFSWKTIKIPLSVTFNYSIFNIDNWDCRIYTYENDVLYSMSIPAYYGHGQKWYMLLKYRLSRKIITWLRVSRITFFDRDKIGSGSEMIAGRSKTEIKIQLKFDL